jgi:hypothetical protein
MLGRYDPGVDDQNTEGTMDGMGRSFLQCCWIRAHSMEGATDVVDAVPSIRGK